MSKRWTRERLLGTAGGWLLRLYVMTLRIVVQQQQPLQQPSVILFWHNRMLAVPAIYRSIHPDRRGVVLTSASRDGEILAGVVARWGFQAARGSSSRRGARALIELRRWICAGCDTGITPDGPRGPRYQLAPGPLFLAQKAGAPVVLLHVRYEKHWELKSWDRFQIPKPFSRVRAVFSAPIRVDPGLDETALEKLREQVQAEMNRDNHGGREA